jgi:hypothetical protein
MLSNMDPAHYLKSVEYDDKWTIVNESDSCS